MRKTFLYVRVSTLDQEKGAQSQARALVEWCEKNNVTDYEIFTDHGISGAKESRPALNQMMEKVSLGEASQVVVWSFSRFARSTSHLLKALTHFREKNTRFISIDPILFSRQFSISLVQCHDLLNSSSNSFGVLKLSAV